MTILQRIAQETKVRDERLRLETVKALRNALAQILPGQVVYVFGSLIQPYRFRQASDVDVAFADLPPGLSIYRVQAELEEALKRSVDVLLLPETRFRQTIENEGGQWTS
ncbi:MAG: nucleotidyltransferase domain-containing protein [Coprothermobacterota bacterium]|nr:nucleotidyltransferase domain-containing protein [Coprothermobacterota bacterium]